MKIPSFCKDISPSAVLKRGVFSKQAEDAIVTMSSWRSFSKTLSGLNQKQLRFFLVVELNSKRRPDIVYRISSRLMTLQKAEIYGECKQMLGEKAAQACAFWRYSHA